MGLARHAWYQVRFGPGKLDLLGQRGRAARKCHLHPGRQGAQRT